MPPPMCQGQRRRPAAVLWKGSWRRAVGQPVGVQLAVAEPRRSTRMPMELDSSNAQSSTACAQNRMSPFMRPVVIVGRAPVVGLTALDSLPPMPHQAGGGVLPARKAFSRCLGRVVRDKLIQKLLRSVTKATSRPRWMYVFQLGDSGQSTAQSRRRCMTASTMSRTVILQGCPACAGLRR